MRCIHRQESFGDRYGIAVVDGAVSDNLCVRDFDSEEDYLRWARDDSDGD